jgi:hypothetical protein
MEVAAAKLIPDRTFNLGATGMFLKEAASSDIRASLTET